MGDPPEGRAQVDLAKRWMPQKRVLEGTGNSCAHGWKNEKLTTAVLTAKTKEKERVREITSQRDPSVNLRRESDHVRMWRLEPLPLRCDHPVESNPLFEVC
eukprot:1150796-Pelagomonas_calceolata.AAC.18